MDSRDLFNSKYEMRKVERKIDIFDFLWLYRWIIPWYQYYQNYDHDQKRSSKFWCQGSFVLLECFCWHLLGSCVWIISVIHTSYMSITYINMFLMIQCLYFSGYELHWFCRYYGFCWYLGGRFASSWLSHWEGRIIFSAF